MTMLYEPSRRHAFCLDLSVSGASDSTDTVELTRSFSFQDNFGLYAIRRMNAQLLQGPSLRECDVRASFGHNPNSHMYDVSWWPLCVLNEGSADSSVDFQKAYVSKNTSIDVQGLLLEGEQHPERLRVSRSIYKLSSDSRADKIIAS